MKWRGSAEADEKKEIEEKARHEMIDVVNEYIL
jgi:hypothetical protein